jgi:hypothetical protein
MLKCTLPDMEGSHRGVTLKVEYLSKLKAVFETALRYEADNLVGSFRKIRDEKARDIVSLKLISVDTFPVECMYLKKKPVNTPITMNVFPATATVKLF